MSEENSTENQPAQSADQQHQGQLTIHKIYIKDISFETPNTPQIFSDQFQQAQPKVNHDLGINVFTLGNDHFEVVLNVTVTVTIGGKTAFLVEIQQAGIFMIKDFPENQKQYMLFSYCPNTIFPYAREMISDLVIRGGFPQLVLEPVNFDAMFARRMQEQMEKNQQAAAEGNGGEGEAAAPSA